jgi:hypothetical protein
MTFGTTAFALGSTTHTTRVLRNMVSAVFGAPMTTHVNAVSPSTRGGAYGVGPYGDMLVTTTGGLGYSIAAGEAVVTGTFALAQGAYTVYNDAAVTGSFGARDAANPRIDLVCVRVRDTDEDATGSEDVSVHIVAGTPAGSPSVPAVSSGLGSLLVLAEVLIPSTASGAALTFTDRRQIICAVGGTQNVKSTLLPTGAALFAGKRVYETDTGASKVYNGSAWVTTDIGAPISWSTFVIDGSTSPGISNTVNRGWYQQLNGVFHAHMSTTLTATSGTPQTYTVTLPLTLALAEDVGGTWTWNSPGASVGGIYYYTGTLYPSTSTKCILVQDGGTVAAGFQREYWSGDKIRLDITGRY